MPYANKLFSYFCHVNMTSIGPIFLSRIARMPIEHVTQPVVKVRGRVRVRVRVRV